MKRSILDKTGPTHGQIDLSDSKKELMKEQIDRTLRTIHKKMIDLFHTDFTYFSNIKIVDKSEVFDWLTRQMENNFQEKLTAQENAELRQLYRFLLESQVKDHFKRLAFYDLERDTLCISEDLLEGGVQLAISASVHELSEKMLSTILSPTLKKKSYIFEKKSLQIEKTKDLKQVHQLFDEYLRLVFVIIFKEGLCEVISLYTLRNMKTNEMYINSLEKEFKRQHSKCISLLFDLEDIRKDIEEAEAAAVGLDAVSFAIKVDEVKKLVMKTLRNSHIIKGFSYYLGYPLAKAFLDRYGLRKTKIAFEKYPPLKGEYFANPRTYLTLLESQTFLDVEDSPQESN